jgi:uncharacterized protein
MPRKILLSGASGFIGNELTRVLRHDGWEVSSLVRGEPTNASQIRWDPNQSVSPESVSGFDAVVHLAGESIMGLWTDAKKARIRDSRVQGTRHLAEALAKAAQPPQVFVSASAIGYYGNRGDEVLNELSAAGSGFLADVSEAWEAAAEPVAQAGIRVVHPRIGIVLSPKGGALKAMLPPFRLGLGGRLGDGKQWMSWIDLRDLIQAFLHLLRTPSLRGVVNMTSPNPVTNAEFTKTLASALSRPAILPIPAFAIKLAMGQMGKELLLAGARVEPQALVASGFSFPRTELKESLVELLQR